MKFDDYLRQPPNRALAARLNWVVWLVTAIVLIAVGSMRQIEIELPAGVKLNFLPAIYSCINALVAMLLCTAWVMIKKKQVLWHVRAINAAMVFSLLFLGLYLAYHLTTEETRYGGEGLGRRVYFVLLASHIVLAAVSLPFILYTWVLGYTNQFTRHRRWAKWVFPIWLYVSISGPICYWMLRPYYAE